MKWSDLVREARERSGISQKEFARSVGVSQPFIAKLERNRVKSSKALGRIVDQLGLDRADFPPEAFRDEPADNEFAPLQAPHSTRPSQANPQVPEFARDPAYWAMAAGLVGDIPLYAAAQGGDGSLIIEREPIGSEKRPPFLQGVRDGYAMFLIGVSMVPEFEPGDIVYVNPRKPVLLDTTCVFYSSDEGEARALVKRFLGESDKKIKVRQHNPAREYELDAGIWSIKHSIVAKMFRGN